MLEGSPGFFSPVERGSSTDRVPGEQRGGGDGIPCTVKFTTGVWSAGCGMDGLGACRLPPQSQPPALPNSLEMASMVAPVNWDWLEIRAESCFTMRLSYFAPSQEQCRGIHRLHGDFPAVDEV